MTPSARCTEVQWAPGRRSRVASRELGRGGVPVVLVHGLGMSSRSMLPALRELGRRTRVLAVDLPGYGRSRGAPVQTVAEHTDALLAWLDARGLDDVVLVGHSTGAQVVCEAVVRRPGLARRLVLAGPTRDPGAATVAGQVLRLAADGLREPPGLWAVAAVDYLRAGPLRMLRVVADQLRHPLERTAARVPVPVLVVRGAGDLVSRQAWCASLVEALPAGRLEVVAGAAHGVPFGRPAEFAAAVLHG